jgi:hypothetical protein
MLRRVSGSLVCSTRPLSLRRDSDEPAVEVAFISIFVAVPIRAGPPYRAAAPVP